MNGATSTPASADGRPQSAKRLAAKSLTVSEAAVETNAPQAKQKIRYFNGSGSYRSSQRKQATSTGTGRMAATTPISRACTPSDWPSVKTMKTAHAAINSTTPASARNRRQPSRRSGIRGASPTDGAADAGGAAGDGGSGEPGGVSAMPSA